MIVCLWLAHARTSQDPAQATSIYTNTIQKTENFSREEEDIAPDLEVDMWCEEEGGGGQG